jgi:hypothetical protein
MAYDPSNYPNCCVSAARQSPNAWINRGLLFLGLFALTCCCGALVQRWFSGHPISLYLPGSSPNQPARANEPARSNSPVLAQESRPQAKLREAIAELDSHQWVSAKIHLQFDLYQQQLIGNGVYRQGPPESHWMLMDLNISLGKASWVLQQRCDGNSHWDCYMAGTTRSITRVDLKRLNEVRDDGPGSNAKPPLLGMGGLSKLLVGLDRAFEFNSIKTGALRKRPMYQLRGEWRKEILMKWLPAQKDAIASGQAIDLSKLPPSLPDHVLVFLGREDLFPYRIEYGRDDRKAPDGSHTLVGMDFDEVTFDVRIDAGEFIFEPGDTRVVDQTDNYLPRADKP